MSTDRLGPPLLFKVAPSSAAGTIIGYGAVFEGPPDSYGDVIARGAFQRSLADHRSVGSRVAMLWNHDASQPLGRWTSLEEDSHGLLVNGQLTMQVPKAAEAYALARDGALGLSIGYRTREATRTSAGNRLLKVVQLSEISLVAMPANSGARITAVKSATDVSAIRDPRAFEDFLRDAGFSRAFAKAVTSHGFKSASGLCDADGKRSSKLARAMREAAITISNMTKG